MIYIILVIVGAIVGSAINWCIYNLGYDKRAISPWSKLSQTANSEDTADTNRGRSFVQYLPIIGWLFRRDESVALGKRFWHRPIALELTWAIGLPLFYSWIDGHGLTAGIEAPEGWTTVWFVGHSILFAFLFVATFIDFDQRIIPDSITVTGTLIALAIADWFPSFRLPEVNSDLAGQQVASLHFGAAGPLPSWFTTTYGLLFAALIAIVWVLALLPKFSLEKLNWQSLKFVLASTVRFLQKNQLKVRARSRKMGLTYLVIGAVLLVFIAIGWSRSGLRWESLFGAFIGLGFGGMMVWLVRIVASHSLGREAMGFGDVTLMAMIGAFLGWQTALIVFALSPFAALAIVAISFLVTKDNELAFGPYLCLGTMISILFWPTIWPMARLQFFMFPAILLGVLAVSLVMLAIMMLGIRKFKEPSYDESDDSTNGATA